MQLGKVSNHLYLLEGVDNKVVSEKVVMYSEKATNPSFFG
jgi:hypothetical protein